jgi:hypothetical protein
LFYLLFGKRINKLVIYDKLWWDFCIDTWDIIHDTYNYDIENKLPETRTYLKMLQEANIPRSYSGCCTCNDWDFYLKLVIDCVLKQIALYSPLFCDIDYNYFFYFHETGSIGLYYHEKNAFIIKVLDQAYSKYIVNG